MVIIIHNYDKEVKIIMILRRMITKMIFWNDDDKDNDNASCSGGDGNVENVRHQMSEVR